MSTKADQVHFVEVLTNVRTIKACAFEAGANRSLTADQTNLQEAVRRRARLGIAISAGSTFINGVASVLLLWIGAEMVMDRRLTVGQLMFFYAVSTMFLNSVERLGTSVGAIQEAVIGLERLSDVRDLRSEHDGILLGFGEKTVCDSIAFEDVSFGYRPESAVLKNLSLRVTCGSTLAVLGQTGSGKSSLVALVAGLYTPSSGRVLVNGRDVKDLDKVALRRRVAMVIQDPGLMSGTIRENIAFGDADASLERVERAAALACASSFIHSLPGGYDYQVGFAGSGLSSGQRQRIAIARALFRDPAVLILDEATSNLDPETEQKVIEALDLESRGRITIIATHRIAVAARADQIIVLDRGAIAESGCHDELLRQRGKYHAMWQTLSPGFSSFELTRA